MIWYTKMQPLSGNQLLELRTSLLKMPLVLRLPRKMHLCRSSSNLPRLPSFLKMRQNPDVLVTFQWMHNPLHLPHKTTSERPKCLRDPQFLTLLTSKCASRHNAVHFFDISASKSAPSRHFLTLLTSKCAARHNGVHVFDISTSKSGPSRQFLTLLTSKCAARHNGVHFFDISTSKSAPRPSVFNTFDFEMCFAPQRCALFRHLNFQKCSETLSF